MNFCLMPPHPDSQVGPEDALKAASMFQGETRRLLNAGVDMPGPFKMKEWLRFSGAMKSVSPDGGPSVFRVVALLCDFADKPWQSVIERFDFLLNGYSNFNNVRQYYLDQSGGEFEMQFTLVRVTLDQPYSYYSANNGFGSFPKNAQGMFRDAVLKAEAGGFTDWPDNSGDGYADGILVIHAGTGAELSGTGIWSHRWAGPTFEIRGLRFSGYTTTPEYWRSPNDATIGVICHELGHELGMPDLYIGKAVGPHCLMDVGSWNGGLGRCPAGLCSAMLVQMGFVKPTVLYNHSAVKTLTGGEIFWLPVSTGAQHLAYLARYRKHKDWDEFVPGTPGLCIERVNFSKPDNRIVADPLVEIVPADGVWTTNGKDDLWPLTQELQDFGPETVPTSNWRDGTPTGVAVRGIDRAPDSAWVRAKFVTAPVLGDLNVDGMVTAEDLAILVYGVFFGGNFPLSADLDADNDVDATDMQLLVDRLPASERARWPRVWADYLNQQAGG